MAPDPTEALEQIILGSQPRYTREDLIRLSGVHDTLARSLWRALGFPDTGGAAAFTDADLDALLIVRDLIGRGLLDDETAVVLARSLGQSTARLADWQAEAVGRLLVEQEHLEGRDLTGDPEVSDRIVDRTRALIDPLEKLLDYAWRRQLAAVLDRRMARTEVIGEPSAHGTVGFADLVGFTRLSRQLEDADLALLVERFEAVSADVVAETGATLVKTGTRSSSSPMMRPRQPRPLCVCTTRMRRTRMFRRFASAWQAGPSYVAWGTCLAPRSISPAG